MLVINHGQMRALAVPHQAAWVARVRSFLEQQAPELLRRAGGDPDRRVEAALKEATGLGIRSEQQQVLFAVLWLVHGPGFTSREAWAGPVVDAYRASGREGELGQALTDASIATARRTA